MNENGLCANHERSKVAKSPSDFSFLGPKEVVMNPNNI